MTKEEGVGRKPSKPFSLEVRERAVRPVHEQKDAHPTQWAAIRSIAEKIGCNAEMLRLWVRRDERDTGKQPGITTDERERLKQLKRKNRELQRANCISRRVFPILGGTVCGLSPKLPTP